MMPPEGIQQQDYVIATEQTLGKQTGNEAVPFLSYSNNYPHDIQESEVHTTTTLNGDTTIPPHTITTRLIEEGIE